MSFQGGLASDFSLLDQTIIMLGTGALEEVDMEEIEKRVRSAVFVHL